VEESVYVCFSFVWFVYVAMCSPPSGPTQYIFHMPIARYSLFVLIVPLNTNKTNKPLHTAIPFELTWQDFAYHYIWGSGKHFGSRVCV